MDNPLISVIMPAYNAGNYIGEAIESVIGQTYPNWELIIVNDGSTDNTAQIVQQFADKRISYFYQSNGKQGKSRNFGIENSKGPLLAFLDADDMWVAEKLATQIQYLANHPETELVFSQGYTINAGNKIPFDVTVKPIWFYDDIGAFIDCNRIPILSVLVKRSVVINVHNFNTDPEIQNVEDYELWIRLLLNGARFSSIPERLFYYRLHTGQSTYDNNNIPVPTVKMLAGLAHTPELRPFKKQIFSRLKWALHHPNTQFIALETGTSLLKQGNPLLTALATLVQKYLPEKIMTKVMFKIFSWA